ncbi:multiple C2 and transmembrane domain-containing protein 1-like isoform X2 [Cynoglossus semilaevis]|uniref:multiple C2 and transmembrane domain-containing protein 1-like isoform X2 n=1 Tax=Cynoglossus semilaevis TaxID=244447 RepID=UPI000D62B85B|nr:multiple C2 and transmembrane domain-containing protein 1-like isoform X2 [Cynoglossus semilaevis]
MQKQNMKNTEMMKQLQDKAKPRLSTKLDLREPDDSRERGPGWLFRRSKPTTVDLGGSNFSSEPDLQFCPGNDEGSGRGTDRPFKFTTKCSPPDIAAPSGSNSEHASSIYKLEIEIQRGQNLAIRDRQGTSDPYVKLAFGSKDVFKSKTVFKNLNPVWNERTCLFVYSLSEPLNVKVFDHNVLFTDDFIGSAYLQLDSLEQQRTTPITLELKDPQFPDVDLGTVELAVTLTSELCPIDEQPHMMQQAPKSLLWQWIVSISLIEGRGLLPMDPNGLSDPYVKFTLGQQKYRSKALQKTLNPQWREQFDLHLYDEKDGVLEISVWDRDTGSKDDFMGSCKLDLTALAKERKHHVVLPLEDFRGYVVLLVRLSASPYEFIADLSVTPLDNPNERKEILEHYGVWKSFSNVKDVGLVQVRVLRAEGLSAADVNGKSDPFCVLELNNERLQTHTVQKNLNPEWNKAFTFNVKDIHSVLEVTVFDEDKDRRADFLGKVAIPLLRVRDGELKGYVLKNKELTHPTKGVIYLKIDVVYNTVKAALRTVVPAQQKYVEEEPKISKQLLQNNLNRVKRFIMILISTARYINSCFQWKSTRRSIVAFVLFVLVVWNFELYMVPLLLFLALVWNYFFCPRETDMVTFEWEVEEEDKEDKDKGFMQRLFAIQEVLIVIQSALDEVASSGERIKNTFNWTVPFLSWLAATALCLATALLYFIPLRYLILAWGVKKFTKKLINPYVIDNNELLDFLSRVPSDIQVEKCDSLCLQRFLQRFPPWSQQFILKMVLGKVRALAINFDTMNENNLPVFSGGELVSGRVIVDVTGDLRVKSLDLVAKGIAKVRWTESRNAGANTSYAQNYTEEVEYLHHYDTLIGEERDEDCPEEGLTVLHAGLHEFAFSFNLPQMALATSFEGKHGNVRYWVKAELHRPWLLPVRVKKEFIVFEHIDINTPLLLAPQAGTKEKTLCCWFCASGPISLSAKIERKGYTPGECIQIFADVENCSSRVVVPKAALYQNQTFFAKGKGKQIQQLVSNLRGDWEGKLLKIPPVSPSILDCPIIKVEYALVVYVDIPGGLNLSLSLPLVIGTIPLHAGTSRTSSISSNCSTMTWLGLSETPEAPPSYSDLRISESHRRDCLRGCNRSEQEEEDYSALLTYITEFRYLPPPVYSEVDPCADVVEATNVSRPDTFPSR